MKKKIIIDHIIETTKDVIDKTIEYLVGFNKGVNNALENDTTNE
jgi:hypothetical protein